MKTKLITTKDYLLLIDEEAEININDYWIYLNSNEDFDGVVTKSNLTEKDWYGKLHDRFAYKKVTAYYPINSEAKELDLPLLPNPFKEADIEKLADNYAVDTQKVHPADSFIAKQSYIEGYKAAQSKTSFTLEDIKKAIEFAYNAGRRVERNAVPADFKFKTYREELIQSLTTQQLPKGFIPEYEYIDLDYVVSGWSNEISKTSIKGFEKRLKTTMTNSENKEVLVGTYKY